jgi:single-stranded DNA-binding protein
MINYTPVPDLIQIIENRECFQSVIPDDEIDRLIDAAERLVGRARQELNARLTSGDRPSLNRLATIIAGQYLAKGREVLITGEIQYRQYQDKEGRQVWVTEIEGRELELIGGRDSTTPGTAPTQAASGRYAGFAGITETLPADTDDDIPF